MTDFVCKGAAMIGKNTICGLSEALMTEIQTIAEHNQINKVIIFGSRARGDYSRTSDIDLAVSGGDIISFIFDVDEKTQTLLKFDVVNLDRPVQGELLDSIKKEGIVIYEEI